MSSLSSLFNRFTIFIVAWQGLMCLFFGLFTNYDDFGLVSTVVAENDSVTGVGFYYPFFQDIHVMIFVGFGFLMTYLKRNGFNSVGFTFFLGALVLQWALLSQGFFNQAVTGDKWKIMHFGMESLIHSDFNVGAILISYGGVLGKLGPFALAVMAFWETLFYSLNQALCMFKLKSVDMGGSMYIHVFGAYFGLVVSKFVSSPNSKQPKQSSNYTGDLFAMIGTLYLWMFWPSFNGALAHGSQQHRVIVNTVLSICASCVMTFVWSNALRHHNKFDMVDIQNATLSGGVAVGCCSDLVISPWGAVLIGIVAGTISSLGFVYLSPFLEEHIGLHDTCGIHNLHGMPGVLGALAGVVSSAIASDVSYGTTIGKVFPARAPSDPLKAASYGVKPGDDRTASQQAWYQLAALLLSLGLALAGGLFTGFFMEYSGLIPKLPAENYYEDNVWWNGVPDEDSMEMKSTTA